MLCERKNFLAALGGGLTLLVVAVAMTSPCRAGMIKDLTPAPGDINSVGEVTLGDLTAPGGNITGISVGDKVFTGFGYIFGHGDMPQNPQDIQVLGFRDAQGNWGITFEGSFRDLPGGTDSDASIRYIVEVDPVATRLGRKITDAHLFLGGANVPDNSYIIVDESLSSDNITKTLEAYDTKLGPTEQSKFSDGTIFDPPRHQLRVTKDIMASANPHILFLPARASVIDQSFSQTPEPATILLSLIGAAAFAVFMRQHDRRTNAGAIQ